MKTKIIEMRELRGDDVFPLLAIIGKLEVVDEFVELMSGADVTLPDLPKYPDRLLEKRTKGEVLSVVDQKAFDAITEKRKPVIAERERLIAERGRKVMGIILQKLLFNAAKAKTELNLFLGLISDQTSTEINQLRIDEYTTMLVGLFKKPELINVFTSAASLLNSMKGPMSSETDSSEDMEIQLPS